MKNGKSEVVCEAGRLIKVSKDKDGVVTREMLTKHWTDWVDYWAVDFDYESRKEIIKVPRACGVEGELPGHGAAAGRVHSRIRGTLDRRLHLRERMAELPHPQGPRPGTDLRTAHLPQAGRYTVAVKVIDIFGNDTMVLVPVSVG